MSDGTIGPRAVAAAPSALAPDQPYPASFATEDASALGVAAPRLQNADGSLRPVGDWARELNGGALDVVRQVGAALDHSAGKPYQYTHAKNLSQAHLTVNQGLARGGGECDWFASVGYLALIGSGRFNAQTVHVGQVFASGGLHNVVFFLNPESNRWDVLDYNKIVHVGAASAAGAMRGYFKNHELGILYGLKNADAPSSVLSLVSSEHRARLNAMFARPGGSGFQFGMTTGVNESVLSKVVDGDPASQEGGLGVTQSGARAQRGPLTMDVRARPDGQFDSAGVSLNRAANGNLMGARAVVSRDPGGRGTNVFMGGEWWHLRPGSFFAVVGGAELRVGTASQRLGDQTETSIAPLVGVQGGTRSDVVGSEDSDFQASGFWNARLRLVAPLVLNAGARSAIARSSAGKVSGGLLDPAVVGASDAGVNVGAAARAALTPRLSAHGLVAARLDAMSFLVARSPMEVVGATADAHLSYATSGFRADAGVTVQHALYDRDAVWRVYADANAAVSPRYSVGVAASAGKLMGDGAFYQVNAVLTRADPGVGTLSAGLGLIRQADAPLRPVLSLSGRF